MKILNVIGSLSFGGAEKLLVETVPAINRRGVCCDVAILNGKKTSFYRQLQDAGCCKLYLLGGGSVYHPSNILKLKSIITKYDIVHVHLFPAQYYVVLAKLLSGAKATLIFTEHNTTNRRLRSPFLRIFDRFFYAFYKRIICITPEVKDELKRASVVDDDKLITITNGVDILKIQSSKAAKREDFGFLDSDILLIMVAAFRTQKDQDTLLRCVHSLPEKYRLLLVGDGERKEHLKELSQNLDIDNRVIFLGNRIDVYSLIKMCDIAVLSSHWEGFGLAAVESMACGIPTIASNVKGLSQVVEGGGVTFIKNDPEDLKLKILSLEDATYYNLLVQNGIRKAEKYDISHMINGIMDVYQLI